MGQHVGFLAILTEFRRALAAARRYETLRYGRAGQEGLAPADTPLRIFDEFYGVERDSEDTAIARGQSPPSASRRRPAQALRG
jgi:hypothetical protein